MPTLQVTVTAKAPLVFSERRPDGQFRASTPYIPGAVLRGSLAQSFIDAEEQTSDDFKALFTAPDAPLFRNAYPAERLLPATAYSCKAESGFPPEKHGVYDGLIDRLCCEELGVRVPYLPRCNHPSHGKDGGRVEAFSSFYDCLAEGRKNITPPSQMTTRVAINRRRKVAEEGLLYSPLVINESRKQKDAEGKAQDILTAFYGSVVLNNTNADHLPLLTRHLKELTHLGSGAARGFGRVEVQVKETPPEDLATRLKKFNERIWQRWKLWERLPKDNDSDFQKGKGCFFALLLMSDAILRDDGWTSTIRLEEPLLSAAGKDTTLLRCYATADYRGGWNTAWGLPKDTELVARRGSVYVYHTTRSQAELIPELREMEDQGVGERRFEGCGQVRVCDEFHLNIWEEGK